MLVLGACPASCVGCPLCCPGCCAAAAVPLPLRRRPWRPWWWWRPWRRRRRRMQGPQPNLDAALGSSAGVQRSGRRVLEALSLSLFLPAHTPTPTYYIGISSTLSSSALHITCRGTCRAGCSRQYLPHPHTHMHPRTLAACIHTHALHIILRGSGHRDSAHPGMLPASPRPWQ